MGPINRRAVLVPLLGVFGLGLQGCGVLGSSPSPSPSPTRTCSTDSNGSALLASLKVRVPHQGCDPIREEKPGEYVPTTTWYASSGAWYATGERWKPPTRDVINGHHGWFHSAEQLPKGTVLAKEGPITYAQQPYDEYTNTHTAYLDHYAFITMEPPMPGGLTVLTLRMKQSKVALSLDELRAVATAAVRV